MIKTRGGVLLFILLVILTVAVFVLLRGSGGLDLLDWRREKSVIPLDLQTLIPPSWDVQAEPQVTCDFDGDGADERLLIYRYDAYTLTLPFKDKPGMFAPFGGVIFDTQADSLPERPESPSPYRGSSIVPYRLLPDFYTGKGQGYLGETGVEVTYSPAPKAGGPCKVNEINVFGFSGTDLPTRLSIFLWAERAAGYQGEHFAGNARVVWEVNPDVENQILRVTTYNRLLNHRSLLCDVNSYQRHNPGLVVFIPDDSRKTIDFCFGVPDEPVHPEGVVVALLRGDQTFGSPSRYLLYGAILAPELALLRESTRDAVNIVSVGNPAGIEPDQERGAWCTPEQMEGAGATEFWCGRERVRVETRIVLDGVVRTAEWSLISVARDLPGAELTWRVDRVDLR